MLTRKETEELRILMQRKYYLKGECDCYCRYHSVMGEQAHKAYKDYCDELYIIKIALDKLLAKCEVSI